MKALFLDAGIRIVDKCALSKLSQEVSLVRPASSFYRAVKVGSLYMQLPGEQEDSLQAAH